MKLIFIILFSLIFSNNWIDISSSNPVHPNIKLNSSNVNSTKLEFNLTGFNLKEIQVNNQDYYIATFPNGASNLEQGMPDVAHTSKSIIIPDNGLMNMQIISSDFVDYENIDIAPSKGNLNRSVNPEDVNFFFNDVYMNDSYYPESIVSLGEPYVLRDLRGQSVVFNPFQYNPVERKLRVYTNIVVEVLNLGVDQRNVISNRVNNKIDNEYKKIYEKHFMNFNNDTRFDYLVDQGNMLIISDANFMNTMQPFIDWKNLKGLPTEMVNVSDIGINSDLISQYVENYYYENGLTFLLLVGDISQIPSPTVSGSASDVSYGCIEGNDFYQEVIVGRFSGNTPTQIATQVERTIDYERNPQLGGDWYNNALGVASNQGPGFNGYSDDVFSQFLWDSVLSNFTYDDYQGIYDGSGGTASQGISAINDGVSIINYTGHGSISSWGNGAPISASQVNSLTNNGQLPFVITVGCNVGEFQSIDESFCEAWMRATNNGEPDGSVAHFGSTISQSWEPPMHGQYAMNLILTESYDENLTRTVGGITANGCMYMNDAQGSSGINETQYWTLFGDPSLNIRTDSPINLSVFHDDLIMIGQDEYVVDVGNEGSLVALSKEGELLASAYSVGGIAILQLNDSVSSEPGVLDLVVTGFNSVPYESTVLVMTPDGAYVSVNEVNLNSGIDSIISIGETASVDLVIENIGTDVSENINISLSEISNSPYVNILDNNYTLNSLDAGQSATISLEFSISNSSPYGHSFSLNIDVNSDSNTFSTNLDFNTESLIESFESSDLSGLNWELGGNANWTVDDTYSADGLYSIKSGSIGNNTLSTIEITLDIVQDGEISFSKRVSCEDVGSVSGSYYDYLAFYIDGVEQNKWAGEIPWSENSFTVSEGQHTFKWSFVKDEDSSDNVESGEDAVWIDQILFPSLFVDNDNPSVVGDVNNDGLVSVLDIVLVVNIVLGLDTNSDGDTNGDGAVDVLDIVNIVNIILNI